ncbi:hypothetical protein HDU97_005137 [Phlyctochytrium planicorne]|nr:hypothetical protein HDU97_005137 [Phlyctochytrium planicorne]
MNPTSMFEAYTNPAQHHQVIVAIDFGTSGTGYAFAYCKPNGSLEFGEILLNTAWPLSLGKKTTTAILLKRKLNLASVVGLTCLLGFAYAVGLFYLLGLTYLLGYSYLLALTSLLGITTFTTKVEAFGDEAVQRVSNLTEAERSDYLYFQKFKMSLHASSGVNNKTLLKDDLNGTLFPAVKVIGACLEQVKQAAMTQLKNTNSSIELKDVLWVITVPAIWKNGAKKLMRDAAVVGGLIPNAASPSLMLVLEPEAASLVCIKEHGMRNPIQRGDAYVVADCGGGTVDLTVHEVSDEVESKVKEVVPASGGDCGSTVIDRAIAKLIEDVLGQDMVKEARRNSPRQWHVADKEFQDSKRSFTGRSNVFLTLPEGSHRDELEKKVAAYNKAHNTTLEAEADSIILSAQDFRKLCAPCIEQTKDYVKSIFAKCPNASKLFLVGNFAHSIQLKEAIREVFGPKKVEIVIPADPGTAVVIGAVMMANSPQRIEERVAPASYGTSISTKFIKGAHPEHLKITTDRGVRCNKVARWFVNIGDKIPFGLAVTKPFVANWKHQRALGFDVLECREPGVIYSEDTSKVKRLGFLESEKIEGTVMYDEGCKFTILFGHTEILARIVDAKGGVTECTIDYQ